MITPDAAIAAIKAALGPRGWSDEPARLEPKLIDWRSAFQGRTPLLVLPSTTDEVARTVALCAGAGLAITPQGGNTSLVGGGIPDGEVLVSLERMRAIRNVDPVNDAMTVEAGAVLTSVHDAAAEAGRFFPLSLGSQGTATIGGLVSTNAGGVAVLRYGMMRDLVLGLEAVLPDGRVWGGLRGLRKDNTGYDLKQLFIGAEGTLGMVTAATLKLFARPASQATAFCGLASVADAVRFLDLVKTASGDAVTAFELMPRIVLDMVLEHVPGTRDPLGAHHACYVLVELSLGQTEAAQPAMETILAAAIDKGLVADAALATSTAQTQAFWRIRESIAEAENKHAPAVKHDVSVPVSRIVELYDTASAAAWAIAPDAEIIAFGHVGDGNIHFNVSAPPGGGADFTTLFPAIRRAVHDAVVDLGGSISAEHGVGVLKRDELAKRRSNVEMDMMRAVKHALDPANIMNPRVLFSPQKPAATNTHQ